MGQIFFRKPFKYTYNRTTFVIIFINLAVFFLGYFLPKANNYIYTYGSLNPVLVAKYHMYWQFVTYMFVHQNISHIFFNMFGLLIFGLQVERAVGSKEFLLFYFICGITDGIFSFLVYYFTGNYRTFLMGASGAIYALLFAFAVVYPKSIIYVWGIIPLPAPLMVFVYTLIEVGSQLLGRSANVAHLTHLFGFASAWLYFLIRMKVNPLKVWKNAYRN